MQVSKWWCGCVVACALLGASAADEARAQWSVTPVEGPNAGWDIDLELDFRGRPSMAYYNGPSFRFVQPVGGTWTPTQSFTGAGQDLVLDRRGTLALSFDTLAGTSLARQAASGTWTTTPILSGNYANNAEMAFDKLNRPHLAVIDTSNQQLKYARWTGTSWLTQTVVTDAAFQFTNSSASIALDANGNAHFSWKDHDSDELKHTRPNGAGGYITTAIAPAASFPYGNDLMFDPQGVLHMAYIAYSSSSVQYATFNGSSWSSQLVASGGGTEPSLTFDAAGQPHIAYEADVAVRYTKRVGGSWTAPETIKTWPNTSDGQEATALRIDRRGGVHIGFSDDSKTVSYAYKAGAAGGITKNITPTFDVEATKNNTASPYVLNDGGTFVEQYRLDSTGNDVRTLMEFNLGSIPDGTTIYSAQLKLEITGHAGGGGLASIIDLYGYDGDGAATLADALESDWVIGSSGPITDGGVVTIDLDPAAIQALLASSDYVGLAAVCAENGYQSTFASSELASMFSAYTPPTLVVTYVPEPVVGLFVLPLAMLARRGRRRR